MTRSAALRTTAPAVLRPAPPLEPPYDDELATVVPLFAPPADVLPFDGAPADPAARRAPGWVDASDFAAQPTGRAHLPDPRPWAARLVQAALEVLAGQRCLQQLMPWMTEEVYAMIGRHSRVARGRTPAPQRLRSLRVFEPSDGVAEICAVVTGGPRSRAIALRLEGFDGRWRCTALELG